MIHPSTPSQTVGPYFAIGMPWPEGPHAVAPGTEGAIAIKGMIYDGAGAPIPDYLLETWQCDPAGRFNDIWGFGGPSQLEGFRGFARAGEEDGDGSFEVLTVKPGRLTMPSGALAAPHIDVSLFARGMLHRVVRRQRRRSPPVPGRGCRSRSRRLPASREAFLGVRPGPG